MGCPHSAAGELRDWRSAELHFRTLLAPPPPRQYPPRAKRFRSAEAGPIYGSAMMQQPFLLGVNYPWRLYAEDFGSSAAGHRGLSLPENASEVAENFARIR